MNKDVFESKFANDVFMLRYSMNKQEKWADTCRRVVSSVCGQYLDGEVQEEIYNEMLNRAFIPGGRYLATAGRPLHQICNCFALRAEDSREGWASLLYKLTMMLSTGGGVGVEYSDIRPKGSKISKTGGEASGPISLMEMVNEVGRQIRAGGDRRSALWAGLNWAHRDIFSFLTIKNRSEFEKTVLDVNPMAPMCLDGTNISVVYDSEFFRAITDRKHELNRHAKDVWEKNCLQAFSTAEPGFSFNFLKDGENLRNACQPGWAHVLTKEGIVTFDDIDVGSRIWDGTKYVTVKNKVHTGRKEVYTYHTSYGAVTCTDDHKIISRGERVEAGKAETIDRAIGDVTEPITIDQQDVMDGLVLGDGGIHKASNNLILLFIGKNDQDYFNDPIKEHILKDRTRSFKTGYEVRTTLVPEDLPHTYLRAIPQQFFYGDLNRMAGFLRGLFSANGSVNGDRICLKQTSYILIKQVQIMLSALGIHSYITTNKSKKIQFRNGVYECKESYDINITNSRTRFKNIIGFIQGYKNEKIIEGCKSKFISSKISRVISEGIHDVYEITVDSPEHVYWTDGCLVSNCAEYTTEDDSDSCNLGSIYLNRVRDKEHMAKLTRLATKFLICGGIYSDMPTKEARDMRNKNNRIGLGLGGVAEWMIENRCGYEVTPELHKLLSVWEHESDSSAYMAAKELGVVIPKAKRAIAPNGTTSILSNTTGGIEPIFCKAYKRKYYEEGVYKMQYVVDGAVKRLMDKGIPLSDIVDAYDISFKQRVKTQADFQKYVDMSISSTCNLPTWGTEANNEETLKEYSKTLLKYAPRLRGFTCYPDGCRGGQPLTRCDLDEALANEGKVFETAETQCIGGVCGI
jgi:ribonucleotide reductase alpha subunit